MTASLQPSRSAATPNPAGDSRPFEPASARSPGSADENPSRTAQEATKVTTFTVVNDTLVESDVPAVVLSTRYRRLIGAADPPVEIPAEVRESAFA